MWKEMGVKEYKNGVVKLLQEPGGGRGGGGGACRSLFLERESGCFW